MPTHECTIKKLDLRFNVPELSYLGALEMKSYALEIEKLIGELEDSLKLYDTTKLAYIAAIIYCARHKAADETLSKFKQEQRQSIKELSETLTKALATEEK